MKTLIIALSAIFLLSACEQPAPKASDTAVETTKEGTAEKKLSPGEKAKAMVAAGALFIDVRSPGEFKSGAIEGAVNIPISEFEGRMGELDKTKSVVVYCASGMRSGRAKGILEKAGFKDVFNMGGIREWK